VHGRGRTHRAFYFSNVALVAARLNMERGTSFQRIANADTAPASARACGCRVVETQVEIGTRYLTNKRKYGVCKSDTERKEGRDIRV